MPWLLAVYGRFLNCDCLLLDDLLESSFLLFLMLFEAILRRVADNLLPRESYDASLPAADRFVNSTLLI